MKENYIFKKNVLPLLSLMKKISLKKATGFCKMVLIFSMLLKKMNFI